MKLNTKPLPGMMELLPEEQMEFNRILGVVKAHHAAFGYAEIDTPVIERTETLLAKAVGETEKQIYRFKKGDNDLSLRFDSNAARLVKFIVVSVHNVGDSVNFISAILM